MKYLKPMTLSLILLGIVLCAACKEDDENLGTPLRFEKTSYEARINHVSLIQIMGGSQSYTLKVEDSNLLKASIVTYEAKYNPGSLSITGIKKGTTTVTITDNKRNEQEALSIKIVDFYAPISIGKSNHPLLKENRTLFIVNNPAKDFYLFQIDEDTEEVSNAPLLKGSYEFSAVEKTPYMTLTYVSETDEQTTHKFNLSKSLQSTLIYFNNHFQLGWEKGVTPKNRALSYKDFELEMTEEDTDYEIMGNLDREEMPEGILD